MSEQAVDHLHTPKPRTKEQTRAILHLAAVYMTDGDESDLRETVRELLEAFNVTGCACPYREEPEA